MNYMTTLIRKRKILIVFFVLIINCKTGNDAIKYYDTNRNFMFDTMNIHNIFDDYYLRYDHFPRNINELIENLKINKDSLKYFIKDPFHKNGLIKYIPILNKDSIYPFAYFITSNNTKINFIKEHKIHTIKKIFSIIDKDTLITNKPVIYYYSNKLLVNSGVQFKYEQIKNYKYKNRYYYDLIIDIKKKDIKIIDNKIIVKYSKNNIVVGNLFSNKVKQKLEKKNFKQAKLIGFKFRAKGDTIYLKNVKFYKEKPKSGYYYDEIGELKLMPVKQWLSNQKK